MEGRSSVFPISSQELFAVLDDASEKTFLCAGTAVSLQKFVFDGEAAKVGMEMRNLIACASFLLEQKLVRAHSYTLSLFNILVCLHLLALEWLLGRSKHGWPTKTPKH